MKLYEELAQWSSPGTVYDNSIAEFRVAQCIASEPDIDLNMTDI